MFGMRFDKRVSSQALRRVWAHGAGLCAILASVGLAACEGCRSAGGGGGASDAKGSLSPQTSPEPASSGAPTLRLYLVSDLAGALEPCGCTKDQLGGMDHLAAWIASERAKTPTSALVAAGPLFFMEPELKADHAAQDVAKSDTIALALKGLGFVGFAPGKNDLAGGSEHLAKLAAESSGAVIVANGKAARVPVERVVVREMNGVKVGFVGVSAPSIAVRAGDADAGAPDLVLDAPADALRSAVADAKKQGAGIVIALAAVGRGEAKRLADLAPDLTAILVGSPGGSGDSNTSAPAPERVGDVIVAETGNHLTTVGVLDLFVRDGSFKFADATGLELGSTREALTRRVDELRARIAIWEKDAKIAKSDLDARRAEVKKLEEERAALDAPKAPPRGSFFRYTPKEVRPALGTDPRVTELMLAYYKQVNEHNRTAFADRRPVPHTPDQPTYVGVNVCTPCHKEARAVWDKTQHAKAYATLASQFKQFNLDCVSCHVTGYDLPGGSTVTHVDRLESVQCEVCHGPGSKHAMNPTHVAIPAKKPKEDMCLSCHHPPHVEGFDPKAKMADILGPGHGL
jgi:hypothetical protein